MASVSPLLLIGTAIVCLGNLLHIIGLSTPYWIKVSDDVHTGLFKSCGYIGCVTIDNPSSTLEAIRAMIIIGMLLALLAGAMSTLFVLFKLLGKTPPAILTTACLGACIAGASAIIIGIIVFAAEADTSDYYGYSFALCIVAAILLCVGGVLVFLGGRAAQ